MSILYDAIGNIVSKSDVDIYTYPASGVGSVRPAAVSTIAGTAQRTGPSGTRTTWYFHPDNANGLAFEQETSSTGTIVNRHYVMAMGRTVLMMQSTGAIVAGSTVAVVDQTGAVKQRYSYDPFGKRRQANGTYDPTGVLVYDQTTNSTDRGFTGHEHLDDVGIVHMNGRTFDPLIARFMQADPFVQETDSTQNYNRYSYVLNNPLNATDPTGQLFGVDDVMLASMIAGGAVTARAAGIIDTKTMRQVLGFAVTFAIAGMNPQFFGGTAFAEAKFVQTFVAGVAGGAMSCGIECAAMGGITASFAYGIGGLGQELGWSGSGVARSLAHGVAGCVTSSASGGTCGQGFASNFVSNYFGENALNDAIGPLAARMVIGGTVSAIGGEKFANGAISAAFVYLFNHENHPGALHNELVDYAAQRMEALMPSDTVRTHRQVTFIDGRYSEVDIVQYDAKTGFLQATEIKTGEGSKWTPMQRSHIAELQSGTFYLKGVPGIDPNILVKDQVRRYNYNLGAYNGNCIYRSAVTRENFREGGGRILNGIGRGLKWMVGGFNEG